MRILTISAQKPNSTGSGVYLTELIHSFSLMGNENALVCGIADGETITTEGMEKVYPVYFNTEELPFPVVGMSDLMPYESTRYKDMTDKMQDQFEKAFMRRVKEAVEEFHPDFILCHHLYFLTALVKEYYPNLKVGAVSHGSDLRQYQRTPHQRERIKRGIHSLDKIFALHSQQKDKIMELFEVPSDKVDVIGAGYNNSIFNKKVHDRSKDMIRLMYAGKISEEKGVACLMRAMKNLEDEKRFSLELAGGYSEEGEYQRIVKLAQESTASVEFLGKLTQQKLAEYFNKTDIFILPSFYEGLPLVIVEALACGEKVVATDLPGVRPWMNENVPDNGIVFVKPPIADKSGKMSQESLDEFVEELTEGIKKAADELEIYVAPDTSKVSWDGVARRICDAI